MILPMSSRRTPPAPAGPGFPLAVPSKFNLQKPWGGHCQIIGGAGQSAFFFRRCSAESMSLKMPRIPLLLGEIVSAFSCLHQVQVVSVSPCMMTSFNSPSCRMLRFWKMRLFLSFHTFHMRNPGLFLQSVFTIALLECCACQLVMVSWMELCCLSDWRKIS